ncbi:MAG: tetratricopeptide repeat protein [Chloroflexi bacterium]|nr:tetratricopeptide repeat protein [Chloroflexota bacterium]
MNDRQKIALRLVLLVLVGSLIGFLPSAISVTQKGRNVQTALANGNYQEGAENLLDLAEANPWWRSLWEDAGDTAFRAGDYQLAKQSYERALEVRALSEDGQIQLGETYLLLGENESAEIIWQELSSSPVALRRLADTYEMQGEITRAVEVWHHYLTLSAENNTPDLIYYFGLLIAADTPPKALVYLDQSAEIYPGAGGIATAIRGSINEEPAYQFVSVGQALAAINHWNLASYAFEKATGLRPDYPEGWLYWGEALQHLENPPAEPLEVLETGFALDEDSPLANLFLGLYWQREGSHLTALGYFQLVETKWPDNSNVLIEQGKSLASLGELESALEKYQAAVELDPLDGRLFSQLAQFCVTYKYHVKESGLPAARIAVQLSPQDPVSLDVLGQVLLALDDEMNAVSLFQQALGKDPTYAPTYFHLGILYSVRDEKDLAVYYLQQVLTYSENPALLDQAERLLTSY